MNKNLKQAWVAALRSGDWRQGYKRLNSNGKYCCLGVLCDVSDLQGPLKIESSLTFDSVYYYQLNDEPLSSTGMGSLPTHVLAHVGLTEEQQDKFIYMNDIGHKSFDEIADWIEENIEEED